MDAFLMLHLFDVDDNVAVADIIRAIKTKVSILSHMPNDSRYLSKVK